MIVIPAIDLKGGKCVRLVKGDYGTASEVAQDAAETAKRFEAAGAKRIHVVDLDGALAGHPVNLEMIESIVNAVGIPVELGGGIRTATDIDSALKMGVSCVILGSKAFTDFGFLTSCVESYGDRIAVGIDALDRRVRTSGWTEDGGTDFIDFAKKCCGAGVANIIYTDISKDGTLNGPNLSELKELCGTVSCRVTASGGIRDLGDIAALKKLGVWGVICGKSVYSGTLDLSSAVTLSEEK